MAVIATGDEVVAPGNPLPQGKLYASNMVEICSWLSLLGLVVLAAAGCWPGVMYEMGVTTALQMKTIGVGAVAMIQQVQSLDCDSLAVREENTMGTGLT